MRAFVVEAGYFLAAWWANAWRWTLRRRRNVAITGTILVVLFAITGMIIQGTAPHPHTRRTVAPSPTATGVYNEATATPVTGGSAPTPAPTSSPSASANSAENVARRWAIDYLTRSSATDTTWKTKLEAYTLPEAVSQLDAQALSLDAPTTVTRVAVSTTPDTATRWSRTLTATIASTDGSVTTIAFLIVEVSHPDGWWVTSAVQAGGEGE